MDDVRIAIKLVTGVYFNGIISHAYFLIRHKSYRKGISESCIFSGFKINIPYRSHIGNSIVILVLTIFLDGKNVIQAFQGRIIFIVFGRGTHQQYSEIIFQRNFCRFFRLRFFSGKRSAGFSVNRFFIIDNCGIDTFSNFILPFFRSNIVAFFGMIDETCFYQHRGHCIHTKNVKVFLEDPPGKSFVFIDEIIFYESSQQKT